MSAVHTQACAVYDKPGGRCDCGFLGHKPPHQQRLLDEAAQLNDRIEKLQAFLERLRGGEVVPGLDQHEIDLMVCQFAAMSAYHAALHARIRRFAG